MENLNLEALVAKFAKKHEKETTLFELSDLKNESLTQSKLGGLPYLTSRQDIPIAKHNGKQMRLLFQINFEDLKEDPKYPDQGILQIWLTQEDDLFGMNFEDPTLQENWRIYYYPEVEEKLTLEEVRSMLEVIEGANYPLDKSYAISVKERTFTSVSPTNFDYEELLEAFLEEEMLSLTEDEIDSFADVLYDEPYTLFETKTGGYPNFTQTDPREYLVGVEDYTEVLFTLDSDSDPENIIIGDSGIMNFMITPEDLANLDFTKVFYTWDCY